MERWRVGRPPDAKVWRRLCREPPVVNPLGQKRQLREYCNEWGTSRNPNVDRGETRDAQKVK